MMVAPKAVAYVCERLGEEGSLKSAVNQIETLKALADLEGYQLVGCYTDILMPGQETRPALEKLIQNAEKESFAEVFVVCAQPLLGALWAIPELMRCGVQVYSLTGDLGGFIG